MSESGIAKEKIEELHALSLQTIKILEQQQQEIMVQLERQRGMASVLELLKSDKLDETLQELRGAMQNGHNQSTQSDK